VTLAHAREVKERHEGRLLLLDCVQGVGVGEDHGRPAIKVYVDDSSQGSRQALPQQLEDVPVVIEESGSFSSY
jgi:hypothetical protein